MSNGHKPWMSDWLYQQLQDLDARRMIVPTATHLDVPERHNECVRQMFSDCATSDRWATIVQRLPVLVSMLLDLDTSYRVHVDPDTGEAELLDYRCPANRVTFPRIEALPPWIRDRVASLRVFDPTPTGPSFDKVGMRIGNDIFYIFPDPEKPEEVWP